ncbi:Arc family DNA-binding protein [Pseudomonadota bacterium]
MPALTIKNIPDDLYIRLKESARAHGRSLNGEILYCIERMLVPYKIDVSDHLATSWKLREKTAAHSLTDEMLNSAKNDGRQ